MQKGRKSTRKWNGNSPHLLSVFTLVLMLSLSTWIYWATGWEMESKCLRVSIHPPLRLSLGAFVFLPLFSLSFSISRSTWGWLLFSPPSGDFVFLSTFVNKIKLCKFLSLLAKPATSVPLGIIQKP